MGKEGAGPPRVFGENQIDLSQDLPGARRQIGEGPDWGGDDPQCSRTLSDGDTLL